MSRALRVPPSPEVMAELYAQYLRRGRPAGLSFKQYLTVIGLGNDAETRPGMDDGVHVERAAAAPAATSRPELISVPRQAIRGALRVKVLLVDFRDKPGTLAPSHYESMLFSKGTFPTGSLRDYYSEISLGKVDVSGSVHGWLRLPESYADYAGGASGTSLNYPRNAQRMAEDAVRAALGAGVPFEPELDRLGNGAITALFLVHAGVGAETQRDEAARNNNIWSHKWLLRTPVNVGSGLGASVYLTVPEDAKVGVCAHELGHLAFQWEDFYDPNYADDGTEWDGSGAWDLMAGGSWNGNGARPAHPAGLHKLQHGWIEAETVSTSASLTLEPYSATQGKVFRVVSPEYRSGQFLLLENRKRQGFDSDLPGEGLLVWRVDEARDMFKPDRPALLLLQADGRHDLERSDDWNSGDSGDPFPGNALRTELSDSGELSTTFPEGSASGVSFGAIARDAASGRVSLSVSFRGATSGGGGASETVNGRAMPNARIQDDDPAGVDSVISLSDPGNAREIAVEVAIRHDYIGDLRVELISPSGGRAMLHDRTGANTHDLRRVFRSSELGGLRALSGVPVRGDWRLRVVDTAKGDTGVLESWALAIVPDRGGDVVSASRVTNLPIPDDDAAGISDSVSFGDAGVARSISVEVDISHAYVGDLRVELVGPTGARALLHNRSGGGQRDLKTTFASLDSPGLSVLVGQAVRGTWALKVADLAGRDTGKLNSWELEIRKGTSPRLVQKEAAPNLSIPDDNSAGAGSSLVIAEAGTLQSIALKASIAHPYIGDLRVNLLAPSGVRVSLWNREGGRTKDLTLDLTSASSPALAALVGQPVKGPWVLEVADLGQLDTGTLKFWGLAVGYSEGS
jgi:immune inhibitor A